MSSNTYPAECLLSVSSNSLTIEIRDVVKKLEKMAIGSFGRSWPERWDVP